MIYKDAQKIIEAALLASQPDEAVKKALARLPGYKGKLILIAIGKAAWQMAFTAKEELPEAFAGGVVITKYGHSKGDIEPFKIFEAGHPVPDKNSFLATEYAINSVKGLTEDDMVLFLVSGGGSSLFEKPLISEKEISGITELLLSCGADISEINTLRKRFSAVKGGKFAELCYPAHVFSVILSDVLGDRLDVIASGPAAADSGSRETAAEIVNKYKLKLSSAAKELLNSETVKELKNVESHITGSVRQLCRAAYDTAMKLGYRPIMLSDCLCCEAREAGSFLASMAQYYSELGEKTALISGGETVVHLKGSGKGGRNQELCLSAAKGIAGLKNVLVFSLGSDGTDGPTDAAGGIVNGFTAEKLEAEGIDIDAALENNDSYTALKAVDSLIFTGPTGTNVNDLSVVLINNEFKL